MTFVNKIFLKSFDNTFMENIKIAKTINFFFFSHKRILKIFPKSIPLRYLWGSKIWAHDLGPGTTFHQQYARGEEIIEDRCN